MSQHLIRQIREFLEAKKQTIHAEIVNTPPPIPACDVHFNTLLEERSLINVELTRLNKIDIDTNLIVDFVNDSSFISTDDAQRLLNIGQT